MEGISRSARRDDRPRRLICPACGYDLRELSLPRCPECGSAFDWRSLGLQPAAGICRRLEHSNWWGRAAVVLRICGKPVSALGPTATLNVPFAPLAPRLLYWTVAWHFAIAGLVIGLGAALGLLLGMWHSGPAAMVWVLLVGTAGTVIFDMVIWVLISFALPLVSTIAWSPLSVSRHVISATAFFFSLSVLAEGTRRVGHSLASLPLELLHRAFEFDIWRWSGLLGYAAFAVVGWRVLWTLRFRPAWWPFGVLIAGVTVAWLLEWKAWVYWFRHIQRPLLDAAGLW